MAGGTVVAVARDAEHDFSKRLAEEVHLLAGLGVEGDAHQGATVQHRSRVAVDPTQPNLRQVHLIHAELFEELDAKGFTVGSGDLGENLTTRGIDLLGLPRGARLRLGAEAVLEVTGLRNPCAQIEQFQPGLLAAVLDRGPTGEVIRKAGIMSVVVVGGFVRSGDAIAVELRPSRTSRWSACRGSFPAREASQAVPWRSEDTERIAATGPPRERPKASQGRKTLPAPCAPGRMAGSAGGRPPSGASHTGERPPRNIKTRQGRASIPAEAPGR